MNSAKTIHKDHIEAIMDLDYSPTGREFVTGFLIVSEFSIIIRGEVRKFIMLRECRLLIVRIPIIFFQIHQHLLIGSEDMNMRLWKAESVKP